MFMTGGKLALVMICSIAINPSQSLAQWAEACTQVYSNSVRNVTIDTRQRSEKSFYFNLYCEKSGATKSFQAGGSIAFPIEGIPIDISGDASWSEQEMKDFCKIGAENNYYSSNSVSIGSFVATDALASFNECMKLGAKDLIMTHSESAPFGVTINGRFTTSQFDTDLDGIVFEEDKLACFSTSFSDDMTAQPLNGRQGYELRGNFAINCLRQPVLNGETSYFPPTSITISTTDGPYTVRLKEDTNLGFNLASEAKAAYDAATARANQMAAERDAAKADATRQLSRIRRTVTKILYQGDRPSNWFHDYYVGCVNQDGHPITTADYSATCGSGSTAAKVVQLSPATGRGCGHTFWAVTCVPN